MACSMKSWVILGFDAHIVCFRHNIGGEGCNCKFNNLFFDVWCVTKFVHHLMHLHINYSLLLIMGLGYQWSLDFIGPLNLTPQQN
jgi:hypothetical protein